MPTRTLKWFETVEDLQEMRANGWRLHVSRGVTSGTNPSTSYNVVWQSQNLAPVSTISWGDRYALAWTSDVPPDGISISIRSPWQPCAAGESYDLDQNGMWQLSSEPGRPGWLSVGSVNFADFDSSGIHIVVGIWNEGEGEYEAIWVDPTATRLNMSARYCPQERMKWWLDAGNRRGTAVSNITSTSASYDFTNPSEPGTQSYKWATTFELPVGRWIVLLGDVPGSVQVQGRAASHPDDAPDA